MKFIHIGDCHLGGWRLPELQSLNFQHFQHVIEKAIKEKVDFMLIAGDLFDSAYPPIEIIKEAFSEFRKLKDAEIPVFLIAGSHDCSASGKTFLDVLEKAGFARNVHKTKEINGKIILLPTFHRDVAIYGYPGKKSSMEVPEIERMEIEDAPGFFKILMLHTALRDAVGTLPIPAVNQDKLPKVDYTALAHLHIKYNKNNRVYCGPTFPNNSTELSELKVGSYCFFNNGRIERREIKLKETLTLEIEITNAFIGAEKIINELKNQNLKDKIIILYLNGTLETGSPSDINFIKVQNYVKEQGAYVLLRNTAKLQSQKKEITLELKSENMEEEIISKYQTQNPSKFNALIPQLISVLQMEKKEEERAQIFEERLLSETKNILKA